MSKRHFVDAPQGQRCKASAFLPNSSERAQCGRYSKCPSGYCTQHHKMFCTPSSCIAKVQS